jgi:hypothetical protein
MYKLGYILMLLLTQVMNSDYNNLFVFQKEEEVATIVIYAKSGRQFSSFDLLFNDVPVISSLPKNTYFVIKHRPGKISLKTKGKMWRNLIEGKEYSLNSVSGSTYYLEAMMEYQVLMTSMHLIRRNSQAGENEIKNMKRELIDLTAL